MNTQAIFVSVRQNYGTPTVYPACNFSRMLAEVKHTKTLPVHTLLAIQRHGIAVRTIDSTESDAAWLASVVGSPRGDCRADTPMPVSVADWDAYNARVGF